MSDIILNNARTATWANIGVDVAGSTDLTEVMDRAGLNFNVVSKPLVIEGTDTVIPNMVANVREDNGKFLGAVSGNYTLVQNKDAFDFVNYIDEDIQFVKAGMTEAGMVYVIGKLPERYILDDKFHPYCIFQNSFNGRYAVQSAICPLRIVCQNQFRMAFRQAKNTITLRHNRSIEGRMQDARDILRGSAQYMDTLNDTANALVVQHLDDIQVGRIVDGVFHLETTLSKRMQTNIEEKREAFMRAYNADDNQNFRGTVWGMVNAFSDYSTHLPMQRKTATVEENRFSKSISDSSEMMKFIRQIQELA